MARQEAIAEVWNQWINRQTRIRLPSTPCMDVDIVCVGFGPATEAFSPPGTKNWSTRMQPGVESKVMPE
jgi:hypothetical protein